MLIKKRFKRYRNKRYTDRIKAKNEAYRGIGLFKYRNAVRSPVMWRSSDPFKACPILSVYAWHKMRKPVAE